MQTQKKPAPMPAENVNICNESTTNPAATTIFNPTLSLFVDGITQTHNPETITLTDFADRIANDKHWADMVSNVHSAIRVHGFKSEPHEMAKRALPYVCPAGQFSHRANDGLMTASGLVQVDVDSLNEGQLEPAWAIFSSDPHTCIIFFSPSGRGVKIFARACFTNQVEYNAAWFALYEHYRRQYFILIDVQAKPMSQPCYVSTGRVFLNQNAAPIPYEIKKPIAGLLGAAPKSAGPFVSGDTSRPGKIIEAAIRAELFSLKSAVKGTGSRIFNRAVVSIASYFHTGLINKDSVQADFVQAFLERGGHTQREAIQKFNDAWTYGDSEGHRRNPEATR